MGLDLARLLSEPLPSSLKGLPPVAPGFATRDVGAQGWNVLAGDLPMPVAVVKASALAHNIAALPAYLGRAGIELAPHGKTTMCPQLFERQLDAGAWGITVATIHQAAVLDAIGVPRVLVANQLVGRAEIAMLAAMSRRSPHRHFYVLVDSIAGARALEEGFAAMPDTPPARVLIEMGFAGGRCGVRARGEGVALARAIAAMDHVEVHGIEGYEGLIVGDDPVADAVAVDAYLGEIVASFEAVRDAGLFADPREILLSAGGSAYFDLVARRLAGEARTGLVPLVPLVRSGCYVTHDSGFYQRLLGEIAARGVGGAAPTLRPALEVWTRVLSTPEPGRAILSAGKRDLSFDIDLPVPLLWFRTGVHDRPQPLDGVALTRLSDQHAFVDIDRNGPPRPELAVGDFVALGISHPCTTFDKWPLLIEVDDAYTVVGGLRTCF